MEREFLDVDDEGQTLVVNVIVISSYFGVNKNVYYNLIFILFWEDFLLR